MKAPVVNTKNEKVGEIEISDQIFGAKWKPALVHQVAVSESANQRHPLAHTKGRGEVSGGGKKPWKQKHTGRARAGSTRSPIWIGGGVALGPRNERDFSKKIAKNMKWEALSSLLSKKLKENEVCIVDKLEANDAKTKEAHEALHELRKARKGSVLLVPQKDNKKIFRAARNLEGVTVTSPINMGVSDCISKKYIILESQAVHELEGRVLQNK